MAHYFNSITDTVVVSDPDPAQTSWRVDEDPYWTEKTLGIQVQVDLVGTIPALRQWFNDRRARFPHAQMETWDHVDQGVFRAICCHERC